VITFRDITERNKLREERQQFTRKLIDVQEEERKRISRDLHDETAQKISLVTLELDALLQQEKELSQKTAEDIRKIRNTANNTLQEVRRFSHELRPSVLEHFGLAEALEFVIEEINSSHQVDISISVTGEERRLPEETEIALFRIAQEALSNIRKHSGATKAEVNIKYTPRLIRLAVTDNGRGFETSANQDYSLNNRLGLVGMRERAQLIGAQLQINSISGKGTTISVEVPVKSSTDRKT
jgi:signal transduction histidine kinase